MPEPTHNRKQFVRSLQVLETLVVLLRRWLPLELKNTRITADDLLYVLSYASTHRTSLETACTELAQAPSGNRFR